MNNCSVAIQVLPQVGTREEIRDAVDKVIKYIKSTGLNYVVGPFETTIEGEFEELMDMIKRCNEIAADEGSGKVLTYVKINYDNNEPVWTIDDKTAKHQR